MNNSDALIKFLTLQGVTKFFMLCGGGAMFLNDAVAKNEDAEAIFMHHEQSCAMAAVAYTRETGIPSCVIVTTGCGVTNAMTGLLDAWQDSVPVFFVSGGVGRKYTTYDNHSRHLGVQEANCRDIVKPYVKGYFSDFTSENRIGYKEIYSTAISGRKGPVWIEMFLDDQNELARTSDIYTKKLTDYELYCINKRFRPSVSDRFLLDNRLRKRLKKSRRPLLLLGNGIRQSGTVKEVNQLIEEFKLPFVTTFGGRDISNKENRKRDLGAVGIKGNRAANFAMQNCDLLLVLGSSLSTAVVGYNFETWCREADVVIVDVDEKEHEKYGDFDQLFIQSDLSDFFELFDNYELKFCNPVEWRKKCKDWKQKYNIFQEARRSEGGHDLYQVMNGLLWKINSNLENKNYGPFTVVGDAGSAYYVPSQTFSAPGHRLITPMAQAEMGATIPYCVGVACSGKKTIGITGDGSFMTNLQELQVIEQLQLPVLLFVWNNGGYLSIRNTQENYFDKRFYGTDESSGLKISNIEKVAEAFGLQYYKMSHFSGEHSTTRIASVFDDFARLGHKPMIVEIECASTQDIFPTVGAATNSFGRLVSRPLEDMKPFMSREEFKQEMIVDLTSESE